MTYSARFCARSATRCRAFSASATSITPVSYTHLIRRLGRIEIDPAVLEILDLTDAGAQALTAGGPVDHPRGQRDGQLIRVPQPVGAGKAVLAEQPVVIAIHQAGVEDRDIVLVAIGDVQICLLYTSRCV